VTFLEILKDGLNNPYVQVNWRIKKSVADSSNIIGFDIYRIKVTDFAAHTDSKLAVTAFDRNAFDRLSIKNLRSRKIF
jgi:hypothetical protein